MKISTLHLLTAKKAGLSELPWKEPGIVCVEAFGLYHKETRSLIDSIQRSEVEIAATYDIYGTGFDYKMIEDINIVNESMSNVNRGANTANRPRGVCILTAPFPFVEYCPRKPRKKQIGCGGIQGIDCLIQFHAEAFVGVQSSGLPYEHLRKSE